jgi:hypothetical protein
MGELKNQPGTFALLRNGGAELTLKSLFVGEFERALNCFALTERERVDLLLVCRECQESWARVEFKHNFISQLKKVDAQCTKAHNQLLAPGVDAKHRFYVHLVVSLDAPAASLVRQVHDGFATGYKHFAKNIVNALHIGISGKPIAWIQTTPALTTTGNVFGPLDPRASACLHVWAQQHTATGWAVL